VRWVSKLVAIELNNDENESYDKGIYTTFKEVIEIKNYKAFNLEAL
jgi:hypothetical protein